MKKALLFLLVIAALRGHASACAGEFHPKLDSSGTVGAPALPMRGTSRTPASHPSTLPTASPASRFSSARSPQKLDPHTITAVPGGTYENQPVASVLCVVRSIGVPLGIVHPSKPNISSTLWRTVHDHKKKVLFFDSATSPNTFWVVCDFQICVPVTR